MKGIWPAFDNLDATPNGIFDLITTATPILTVPEPGTTANAAAFLVGHFVIKTVNEVFSRFSFCRMVAPPATWSAKRGVSYDSSGGLVATAAYRRRDGHSSPLPYRQTRLTKNGPRIMFCRGVIVIWQKVLHRTLHFQVKASSLFFDDLYHVRDLAGYAATEVCVQSR